jgi:hypothetical protein
MPTPRIPLLALLCLACASLAAADRKPNFVYVYTDDQRWDALGVVQQEQGEKGRSPGSRRRTSTASPMRGSVSATPSS